MTNSITSYENWSLRTQPPPHSNFGTLPSASSFSGPRAAVQRGQVFYVKLQDFGFENLRRPVNQSDAKQNQSRPGYAPYVIKCKFSFDYQCDCFDFSIMTDSFKHCSSALGFSYNSDCFVTIRNGRFVYTKDHYLNCGETYEDMIDHHSYAHNLSSCEIKPWKKTFRPERDSNPLKIVGNKKRPRYLIIKGYLVATAICKTLSSWFKTRFNWREISVNNYMYIL